MARAGDVVEIPQIGERFVFRRTSQDTAGEVLEFEQIFDPGCLRGLGARAHVHSRQSERHTVLAGKLGLQVGDRRLALNPGDTVDVPPDTSHRTFAIDRGEVRILLEVRPALKTEAAIESWGVLAREGKVNRWGSPPLLQLMVLAHEYHVENRMAWPPPWLQTPLVRALARLGHRRGYRLIVDRDEATQPA